MAVIFNPKFLNQDQQVGKNKCDIKKLKSQVAFICNTQNELAEDATSVLREDTDVGNKPIENSLILSRNGNVFKIEATSEDQTILYLKFYASLIGPEGPQGEQGESIVGPEGPQGPRGEAGESIVGPTGPQGPPGQNGTNGTSAGFGTPTASVDSSTGTPSVTITSSGPDTAKVFNFDFHNLKGEQGIQGPQGESIVGPRGPKGDSGQSIVGPQGPRGPKGDNGNSFVVTNSVVSVNDLPPASSTPTGTAYFVGGTYPRPVYVVVESEGVKIWQNEGTLQGPEGPQGIQGVPGINGNDGIGVTFMGAWLSGQTYYYNDCVTYTENGVLSSYILINENGLTSTTPPPQDTTNWQPSARGVQGPQGPAGQNGTDGMNGTNAGFGTPTASVDSNTGTPSVTITSSGPNTAKVFNFAFHNLKGERGPQGEPASSGQTKYHLVKTNFSNTWVSKTWTGLTNFYGTQVWTDGTNIYYSNGSTQYVLNIATSTWTSKTWSGLTKFYGTQVWTDGTNIYCSSGSTQYVLNVATSTWSTKNWSGFTNITGSNVWTNGTNIYYSSGTDQYVLNVSNSTWSAKTWSGLTSFSGSNVWTDGTNIYYSQSSNQYVLDVATSTWTAKTWTGYTSFSASDGIWTDGTNIYFSTSGFYQYVLNAETSTWSKKTWRGVSSVVRGEYIWTDGTNIYYSNGSTQYVLGPIISIKTKLK